MRWLASRRSARGEHTAHHIYNVTDGPAEQSWWGAGSAAGGEAAPDLGRFPPCGLCRRDALGPGSRVAFRRPLPRRVDPHLAAERRQIRRIVEIVDRPFGHLDVAQRIHVRADDPRDLTEVLHVDVLVDDDDGLREHQLAEAPEG